MIGSAGIEPCLGGQNVPESSAELSERITKSIGLLSCGEAQEGMRSHLVWSVRQILAHITPDDLTAPELAALVAVLVVPHSRWIEGRRVDPRPPGPRKQKLTIVPTRSELN